MNQATNQQTRNKLTETLHIKELGNKPTNKEQVNINMKQKRTRQQQSTNKEQVNINITNKGTRQQTNKQGTS